MTEKKRVIALGFFDGVHLGHGTLMTTTVQRASELNAEPAVVSFDTHPDSLVKGEAVPLIFELSGNAYSKLWMLERNEP